MKNILTFKNIARSWVILMILQIIQPEISWAQTQAAPHTFLLNGQFLQQNKIKVKKGDPALKAALTNLITTADEALKHGPYSVTQKSILPSSGDKHDYMSVGPYWWPDPTKPNGLPYIRKDGEINPERHKVKDADYVKELSHDVTILGLAYYFTTDEKYVNHAATLLRTWFLNKETRMNPNLNFGQAISGITKGRGIGLIDTKVFLNLIDGVQLLQGSNAWKAPDQQALQKWFRQFTDWMLTSPIGKDEADEHNNHGVYYDLQAATFALFYGDNALAKNILQKNTQPRINSQINEDGSQPHELARTKSWSYSHMNLKGFFSLALLGEQVGVDLWQYKNPKGAGIKEAFMYLANYASSTKTWQHQQISPIDYNEFLPLARVAAVKYPEINKYNLTKKLKSTHHPQDISLLAQVIYY